MFLSSNGKKLARSLCGNTPFSPTLVCPICIMWGSDAYFMYFYCTCVQYFALLCLPVGSMSTSLYGSERRILTWSFVLFFMLPHASVARGASVLCRAKLLSTLNHAPPWESVRFSLCRQDFC
ncbi:unnamed protein product [Pylaiella littoralis]